MGETVPPYADWVIVTIEGVKNCPAHEMGDGTNGTWLCTWVSCTEMWRVFEHISIPVGPGAIRVIVGLSGPGVSIMCDVMEWDWEWHTTFAGTDFEGEAWRKYQPAGTVQNGYTYEDCFGDSLSTYEGSASWTAFFNPCSFE